MIIAILQHRLRQTADEDIGAVVESASAATKAGAELLVLPEIPSLFDSARRDELYRRMQRAAPRMWLIPHAAPAEHGTAFRATTLPGAEELGRVAMPVGDAAIDPDEVARLAQDEIDVLIMAPRSRSELQAEAALELAIGLSDSVAGLVLVVEPIGAEVGEPGHGGAAIAFHGDVLSEAVGDDDLLIAEVAVPVPRPETPGPVPAVPPILLQRLAHHRGERLAVDYLADLS